jgi:DNA-binding PadR family transcriptional regulator
MSKAQPDINDTLRDEGPDAVRKRFDQAASKTNGRQATGGPSDSGSLLTPQARFLEGFVPPEYIVDGILQRRFLYSLTGVTGGGKTALALTLTRAIGCADPNATFGGQGVEKGKVIYFVGENPDDVRARLIGTNAERNDDASTDRIHYIVGVFDIQQIRARLITEAEQLGGVDLVIIDTSAAYFLKDDENSNPQMGEHARMLRSLTTLPGGPCIVALCHPIKHVTDPSQLLPRGGGAFLNEVDGNLTAWRHDENLVTLHHNKLRGPGFEPISFKLEPITTPKLIDSKGRQIPTVRAIAISVQEQEAQERDSEGEEDQVLVAIGDKLRSIAEIANACNWLLADGKPYRSRVDRVLKRLLQDKLIRRVRGKRYRLTDEGKKLVEEEEEEERAEDRVGAPGGKKAKAFYALKGMKQRPTVPCAFCGKTGDVYKIGDGRLPKGKRRLADLHDGCAEPYFIGKPKPESAATAAGKVQKDIPF